MLQPAQSHRQVLARRARRGQLEAALHLLATGVGLEIPPGAAHGVANASAADVEFLVVSQPPSHGDRETAPL